MERPQTLCFFFLNDPAPTEIYTLPLHAALPIYCRPTAGAGALLAMSIICAILTWRALTRSQAAQSLLALSTVARPGRHALVAAVAIAITLATYFSVNYAKFQTFEGVPLRYYAWYNAIPIRMKITGGKQLHLENIPTSLATYFGIHGASFNHAFPWVFPAHDASIVGSPSIDAVES